MAEQDTVHLYVKEGLDKETVGGDQYAMQVHMFLLAKQAHNFKLVVVPVNKARIPAEIKKEYSGQLPAVMYRSYWVDDVEQIFRYINSCFPRPDIAPADQDQWDAVENNANSMMTKFATHIKGKQDNSKLLLARLEKMDKYFAEKKTKFALGDTLTLVDCVLLPKLQHFRIAGPLRNFHFPTHLVALCAYMQNAYSNDVFIAACPSDQDILAHWKGIGFGSNYRPSKSELSVSRRKSLDMPSDGSTTPSPNSEQAPVLAAMVAASAPPDDRRASADAEGLKAVLEHENANINIEELSDEHKENIQSTVEERRESVKDTVEERRDSAAPASVERRESTKDAVEERRDSAAPASEERRESTKDAVEERRDSAAPASEERRESTKDAVEERREGTKDAVEERRDSAAPASEERRESTKDALEERRESATPVSDERRESAKDAVEERRDSTTPVDETRRESTQEVLEERRDSYKAVVDELKDGAPPAEEQPASENLTNGGVTPEVSPPSFDSIATPTASDGTPVAVA